MKTEHEWANEMNRADLLLTATDRTKARFDVIRQIRAETLREATEILDAGLNRGTREHILIARDAILARAKELEK